MAFPDSFRWLVITSVLCAVMSQVVSQGQCNINGDVVVPDANARFAFMMSMRKTDTKAKDKSCIQLSREPLQNYLAAEWVVHRINAANNGTGYIPGFKLGFFGLDDCRSPVYSSNNALTFLDAWLPESLRTCVDRNDSLHIGIVGPSRSSTSTRVAALIRDIPVPVISMSSTSAELSDKAQYPTFFRTVPPDIYQMSMIIDILSKLHWSYVAVVYVNDSYGISATQILSEKARQRGICIDKTFPDESDLTGGQSATTQDLQTLLQSAKDNSVAVIFIGSRDKAEQFMWKINSMNDRIKYGFHIILSEATNTDVSIYRNKDVGVGTLTVATSSLFLDDLHKDLLEKVRRVENGQETHKLIEEYNKDFPSEPLIHSKSLDTFVPLTVHAVFAMAEGLKNLHSKTCGGKPGMCSDLAKAVDKGSMLTEVKGLKVDYGSMEPGLPPKKYRDNNYTVSFDDQGDIRQVNNIPAYAVYQYRGGTVGYEQVGTFADGETTLDMQNIKMLTPSGAASKEIPSSVCSGNCAKCLSKGRIPIAFLEGDAYILGIFSLHESNTDDPFACGNFRSVANDAIVAEAFLYTVQDLRRTTGINFGAIGIDDCYSALRSTSVLSDYFSDIVKSDMEIFTHHIPREKLAGVVACRSSGCTIPTAMFFMPLQVPMISYAASSPDLDDRINYPTFMRTVPSDVFQAEVMLKIVQMMKWEYVGLMYVQNNYGAKAMKAFKDLVLKENTGVCVAEEIGITEKESEVDNADFFAVWSKLIQQDVKVVVFFGIDVRYRAFLKFMEDEQRHGRFILIGSEDWGNNQGILQSGPKSARGSLTLKVQEIKLETEADFRKHLAAKKPTANDSNIWYQEFWQNVFQCNFKGGFINTFSRECDPNLSLSPQELDNRVGEQRMMQVMNAVYALGKGLAEAKKKLCEDEFPCRYLREYVDEVVLKIREQTRQEGGFKYRVFDNNGNGAIGFDVFNIQQTGNQYEYVQIGLFNSKDEKLDTEKLKFYSETGNEQEIIAKCTQSLCNHCPKPSVTPGDEPEGSNSSDTDYRDPDILLISLVVVLILAILVAIAVVVVCFTKYRRDMLKKMEARDDQIYAEPERIVYQPYQDTHGFNFANEELGTYPGRMTNDTSNGTSSNRDVSNGVSNPNFIGDNIDSVSQVLAARNQHRFSQPDLRNRIRNDPTSLNSSAVNSHYSSRPLPVSPMSEETLSNIMHDNLAYQESTSDINGRANPSPARSLSVPKGTYNNGSMASDASTGYSDRITPSRSQDSLPPASGQLKLIMPNSNNQVTDASGMPMSEAVVYYMQGPNGELTAQISSPVQETRPILHQNQSLAHGSSVHSGSSSVDPNYGPYSAHAALQLMQQQQQLRQLQQQQQQQQAYDTNSKPPPSSHYRNTPIINNTGKGNAIELRNMNTQNAQRSDGTNLNQSPDADSVIYTTQVPQTNQHVAASGSVINESPIHYAYPTNNSQVPTSQTAVPPDQYKSLPTQQEQLQQNHQINPQMSGVATAGVPANLSPPDHPSHQQFHHSQTDQPQQAQPSPTDQQDLEHVPYVESMNSNNRMNSSVPDVVGQSSPMPNHPRQLSFETVDLSSSKESLDNLDANVHYPNNNNNINNRMQFSGLSALDGNVTRV